MKIAILATVFIAATFFSNQEAIAQSRGDMALEATNKILHQHAYHQLDLHASRKGHSIAPDSITISSNEYGLAAMAPYHDDMLDIHLDEGSDLAAIYFSPGKSSQSKLERGVYTLRIKKVNEQDIELQMIDGSGNVAQSSAAKILFEEGEEAGTKVDGSIKVSQDIGVEPELSAYCWVYYYSPGNFYYYRHGYCQIIIIAE